MTGLDAVVPPLIDGDAIRGLAAKPVMDALERRLADGFPDTPPRSHVDTERGVLLTMPSTAVWAAGVKVVTVAPGNPKRGLPAIQGSFVMFDADTSAPVAILDAAALTELRTAALTALVTRAVAPPDASRLVLFGAGAQARAHLDALLEVYDLKRVDVVDRVQQRAEALAERARAAGVDAGVAGPEAVSAADLVCTCTTSDIPVFDGGLLRSSAHVNAIGAFQPHARELDDAAVWRVRIVVETRAVALAEAGDLLIPLRAGVIEPERIVAEVPDVLVGGLPEGEGDITIYKAVGHAYEDLVVAAAVMEQLAVPEPAA
jgi:ornithine cyclodeaminase/alanine dehydrogenase-like protein (mu-crystallin family)